LIVGIDTTLAFRGAAWINGVFVVLVACPLYQEVPIVLMLVFGVFCVPFIGLLSLGQAWALECLFNFEITPTELRRDVMGRVERIAVQDIAAIWWLPPCSVARGAWKDRLFLLPPVYLLSKDTKERVGEHLRANLCASHPLCTSWLRNASNVDSSAEACSESPVEEGTSRAKEGSGDS
jgi:hypothetical protein